MTANAGVIMVNHEQQLPSLPFTYDDILTMLDDIERDDFEERYSPSQIAEINYFLVLTAMAGTSKDLEEQITLDEDIQDLYVASFEASFPYGYATAYQSPSGIIPCGWIKDKCHQTKKFVKKHKKAIIIGTVVVVVVVAVVVTAGVAAAPAAASAGTASSVGAAATTVAVASLSGDKEEPSYSPPTKEPSSNPEEVNRIIESQVSAFKESIEALPSNTPERSFRETVREIGSMISHEVIEASSEMIAIFPLALEGIVKIGENILPQEFLESRREFEGNRPLESFKDAVASTHEELDQVFDSNRSQYYTDEFKERQPQFDIGIVPLPTSFFGSGGVVKIGQVIQAETRQITRASSVCGWKLGQDITNRTAKGGMPTWGAVKNRYWKNRAVWAKENPHKYGENIPRMEKGLAPQRMSDTGKIESMELHHIPPQRDGGLFDFIEVWPAEHSALDSYRHIGGN